MVVTKPDLPTTQCIICEKSFDKIEYLNVHMRPNHHESDHERMERLTETFRSMTVKESNEEKIQVKFTSFECSECGLIFTNSKEQKNHFQNYHGKIQLPPSEIKKYMCTECALIFSTLEDQKVHEEEYRMSREELSSEILGQSGQNPQTLQVTIQPQESWLSKSLPNLADLLATIPITNLVSKEDELKSQQDFKVIMCEVKTVKVQKKQEM